MVVVVVVVAVVVENCFVEYCLCLVVFVGVIVGFVVDVNVQV